MEKYNGNHKGQAANILKIGKYGRRGFTRILNETLCNRRLSGMARAIMGYLLSKQHDWKPRVWDLANEFDCCNQVIQKALKNLEAEGYAHLVKFGGGDCKACGSLWQIRESPELPWGAKSRQRKISTVENLDDREGVSYTNERSYKRKSSTKKRVHTQRVHVAGDAPDVVDDKAVALKTEEEERVCDAPAAASNERTTSAARCRREVDLSGYDNDERCIIDELWHNKVCAADPRCLPVTKYSQQVSDALAVHDYESFADLCEGALNGEASWGGRKNKTLVGLVWSNY